MSPWRWIPVLLILALLGLVTVIFLPSFLELNNPKDEGPRKIADSTTKSEQDEDEESEK